MRLYILGILLFAGLNASAQILNDDCQFATFIPDIDGYCSDPAEFTNLGAESDPVVTNSCFLNFTNGVWFSFTPTEPAVSIKVFGRGNGINTIGSPKIALFSGCGDYLTCSAGSNVGVDELVTADLIIGQVYFIMVESAPSTPGSFQLCINDFQATPSPESDCDLAVVLCDKSPFTVESLNSTGLNPNESDGSCIGEEKRSSWYVWECDEAGSLTMELTPSNIGIVDVVDDLDFVIFELPNGVNDCENRIELRCMGSGANTTAGIVDPFETWAPCNRATGMREGETDIQEGGGCQGESNNYIAPLIMEAGKTYGMLINNFSPGGLGFSLEFGGTGTFVGPEADFIFDAVEEFECDKTINFTDLSDPGVDPIVNYTWNFGAGSTPSTASGPGPFSTVYESFGDKVAALTIESSRGCLVTKTVDLFVEPCCQDTSTLDVDGLPTDVDCFGDEDGQILAEGFSGSPAYSYSLDGINFQPNPRFLDLPAGDYNLFIVDIKGCRDTTIVPIFQPTQTVADAGPDMTVDLGSTGVIDGSVITDFDITNITWSPLDSFVDCTECLTPEVFPLGATTYTLTVTDENGCTSSDEVQFLINVVRPVFWPNIFSPNEDNTNDFFNISGGPAIDRIESLKVYDRWGNLMYDGMPELNSRQDGWDGTFNGKEVNPGVYAWIAAIRFIDRDTDGNNVVLNYSGDITVIR